MRGGEEVLAWRRTTTLHLAIAGAGPLPGYLMPWHLDLGWAGSPSGQALWVGGLVPIGNGLDIINPANHQPQPSGKKGTTQSHSSPRKLWFPYSPSSEWDWGCARLCS